ncbi:Centromere protein X [Plecturocebus cupreus]
MHFKDDKTKGAVSGDALQLMAELLKIFVVGEPRAQSPSQVVSRIPFVFPAGKPRHVFLFPPRTRTWSPEPVGQVLQPGSEGCLWTWVGALAQAEALGGPGFKISRHPPLLEFLTAEAAVRGVRQAQAEDAILVDVDQLEKVLPQLVCECGSVHRWGCLAGRLPLSASLPHSSWTSRDFSHG